MTGEVRHLRLRVGPLRPVLDNCLAHRETLPVSKIDLMVAEGGLCCSIYIPCDLLQHLLGELHQVPIVRVGLIELEHREFGVMLCRDPLVAKVAVDLIYTIESPDDKTLQVQLRRYAKIEIDIQRIVMCDKWPRDGAASDRLHHRRFDFYETARIQKVPDRLYDSAALYEDLAHIDIHRQIDVTLTVA